MFGATDLASSCGDDLQPLMGEFTAFVGETLRIEYGLTARAVSSIAGWNGLPRSAQSNYGNSAFLYFSVVDQNVDVRIEGQAGFDYVAPAIVPLPPAGLLLFSAFGLLARARTGRAYAASRVASAG